MEIFENQEKTQLKAKENCYIWIMHNINMCFFNKKKGLQFLKGRQNEKNNQPKF